MAPNPQRLNVDIEWLRKQSKNWTTLGDRMDAVKQGTESVKVSKAGIEQPIGSGLTNIATFISAYDVFVTNFQNRTIEGADSCHAVAKTVLGVADAYQNQDAGSAANIQGTGNTPGMR